MRSKLLSEKINIAISNKKKDFLKEVAKANGRTLSNVINRIIDCERIAYERSLTKE